MIYSRAEALVHLDKLEQNLEHMRKNLKETTKIIAVVKTDGYGHGAVEIGRFLENKEYIFGFAVATVEEGIVLRNHGIKKPVLLLGMVFPEQYKELVAYDITATVFQVSMAKALAEEAMGQGKVAKVHLKVDTGMGRIGIVPSEEALLEVKEMTRFEGLEWEGIFTHLARADETDKSSALQQIKLFKSFIKDLEREGVSFPLHHCANSAGIMEIEESDLDLVRAGISMYGLMPSEEVEMEKLDLQPVLELKTRIAYCKEVEPGTAISYGGTYVTTRKTRIATLPIGYGDGYPRSLSGKGYVLINGKKAPILGRICMDQCMVDVTDITEAKEGDCVTLIGKEGEEMLSMDYLGQLSGRFNYEFACDLSKRIPRVYYYKEKKTGTKDCFSE